MLHPQSEISGQTNFLWHSVRAFIQHAGSRVRICSGLSFSCSASAFYVFFCGHSIVVFELTQTSWFASSRGRLSILDPLVSTRVSARG